MAFENAKVLVTGGTSGIGASVAALFAEAGAQVTITGTRGSPADYNEDLSQYAYRQFDVESTDSVDALGQSIADIDILINNGGVALPSIGLNDWEPEIFARSVNMMLTNVYRTCAVFRDKLSRSSRPGGGSIVSVGSMSSLFGIDVVPGYGAAKTGLIGLTRVLAVGWGPKNIRANAVAAGLIESRMTAVAMEHVEMTAPTLARTPLGRIGVPEDVAGPILFLCSPAAAFVTGQTLPVDGGYSVFG